MNSYLIIKVNGSNITNFINKCHKNNINIINIKKISYKEIIIKINYNDYEKLNKIKTIYKLTIIDSLGYLKFRELLNKNKHFLIISFLGVLFLIYLSNIIFNINIISANSSLNKKVLNDLNAYGIKKYSLKKSYDDISNIKQILLEKYNDEIEWIEITNIGTKYEIKIVERKKPKKDKKEEYSNIVAKKSGVIKEIYAEDGMKVVDVNTYVNKGDIVISGAITKDDKVKKFVEAKGKVYAEVWYNVNIEFPLNYIEKRYTNNKKKSFYIKINNKYITKKRFKNFERNSIVNLKNKLIPFEIGIEEQREVIIIKDKYSINEAKIKALENAKSKVLQSLDKGEFITLQKTLNFSSKDSKIIMDVFFSCYEEIGKKEKIIPE